MWGCNKYFCFLRHKSIRKIFLPSPSLLAGGHTILHSQAYSTRTHALIRHTPWILNYYEVYKSFFTLRAIFPIVTFVFLERLSPSLEHRSLNFGFHSLSPGLSYMVWPFYIVSEAVKGID